jgi:hypothetical protein
VLRLDAAQRAPQAMAQSRLERLGHQISEPQTATRGGSVDRLVFN